MLKRMTAAERPQPRRLSSVLSQNFYFAFSEIVLSLRYPASLRGAYRGRHEREAGSGGRDGVARRAASVGARVRLSAGRYQARRFRPCARHLRGRPSRVVLAPRCWRQVRDALTSTRATGARLPVPGESTEQPVKPSRREGRDVSAEPVVTAACFLFCRRAMGAASSRPSLRPRILERADEAKPRVPARPARTPAATRCLTSLSRVYPTQACVRSRSRQFNSSSGQVRAETRPASKILTFSSFDGGYKGP